jgi:hypothetical protein
LITTVKEKYGDIKNLNSDEEDDSTSEEEDLVTPEIDARILKTITDPKLYDANTSFFAGTLHTANFNQPP